ncbi:MAG: four helix bundle protein [FCB group bacterium]|nr:four helix bundle protein [FCB group bacterium]
MDKRELENRTKAFSLQVIRLVSELPRNKVCDVIGYQLMKSGTAIGANYREATRAASRADFIHKISIVEKEANETLYWLELLIESLRITDKNQMKKLVDLKSECEELLAIFTATGKTAKRRK